MSHATDRFSSEEVVDDFVNRVFNMGREARRMNNSINSNPYPARTSGWRQWRNGWTDEDMGVASSVYANQITLYAIRPKNKESLADIWPHTIAWTPRGCWSCLLSHHGPYSEDEWKEIQDRLVIVKLNCGESGE